MRRHGGPLVSSGCVAAVLVGACATSGLRRLHSGAALTPSRYGVALDGYSASGTSLISTPRRWSSTTTAAEGFVGAREASDGIRKDVRAPRTRLHVVYPELLDEWVAEMNDVDVTSLSSTSPQVVVWRCGVCQHVYEAPVRRRIQLGLHCCPACHGNSTTAAAARDSPSTGAASSSSTSSEGAAQTFAAAFPELVRYWDQQRNGALTPQQVPRDSLMTVWWRCPAENGREESFQRPICAFAEDQRPLHVKREARARLEQQLLDELQQRAEKEEARDTPPSSAAALKAAAAPSHRTQAPSLLLQDWAAMTVGLQREIESFEAANPSAAGRRHKSGRLPFQVLATEVGPRAREHFMFFRSSKYVAPVPSPHANPHANPAVNRDRVEALVRQQALTYWYQRALWRYEKLPHDAAEAERLGVVPDAVLLAPQTWTSFFFPSEEQAAREPPQAVAPLPAQADADADAQPEPTAPLTAATESPSAPDPASTGTPAVSSSPSSVPRRAVKRFSSTAELRIGDELPAPPEMPPASVFVPFPLPPEDTMDPKPAIPLMPRRTAAPASQRAATKKQDEVSPAVASVPEEPHRAAAMVEDEEHFEPAPEGAPEPAAAGGEGEDEQVGTAVDDAFADAVEARQSEKAEPAPFTPLQDDSAAFAFSRAGTNPAYARPAPKDGSRTSSSFRMRLPRASPSSSSFSSRLVPPPSAPEGERLAAPSAAGPAARAAAAGGAVLEAPRSPRKVSRPKRAKLGSTAAETS
eukprot:gene5730-4091_t